MAKEQNLMDLAPETIDQIPPELKKKLSSMKSKLDKLKKEVLNKFDKFIISIALLPPTDIEKEKKERPVSKDEEEKLKDQINILILVDDGDSKMDIFELKDRLTKTINEMTEKIDKNMSCQTMLLSELRESCFDGKYEILGLIGMSAIIYDKGLISALKVAEIHKRMSIDKFEKYVLSYVAAGSLFRGDSNPHDIDVYIVIDDTDVKRMSRAELKDKLRAIIQGMGFEAAKICGIKANFHVQTYILTDFWDSLKDANPVIFTLLRDGVPLYDRGTFMPWKLLLKMGRIKPSSESIDMNMDIGEKLLIRSKQKLLSVVGEDLYWASLNPAQAALMLYGLPPPTPKETVKLFNDIFVKKEKLLEKKYVDILERLRRYYKDVEHGKVVEVSGKQVDDLLKDVEDYLKRIRKLFEQIEKKSEKENLLNVYDTCIAISRDALYLSDVKEININKIDSIFKENLVDKGLVPEKLLRTLKSVIEVRKDYQKGKLSKQEVEKTKREARIFIKAMTELIQRKKSSELDRSRIRFKYSDKFGEVYLFKDKAFIIEDIEKKDVINTANISKNGSLTDLKQSSFEEFEKYIAKAEIPNNVFVKEKLFESLKELYGKGVEIMVNY